MARTVTGDEVPVGKILYPAADAGPRDLPEKWELWVWEDSSWDLYCTYSSTASLAREAKNIKYPYVVRHCPAIKVNPFFALETPQPQPLPRKERVMAKWLRCFECKKENEQ